jgi:hypothetical protein
VLIDEVRAPIAGRNGALSGWHPVGHFRTSSPDAADGTACKRSAKAVGMANALLIDRSVR